MRLKKLAHLTLLTGHLRDSPRHEVGDDIIGFLRSIVDAGAGELGDTGWSLRMVEGPDPGSCGFTLRHRGVWLVSCYMAWTRQADMPMWRVVEQIAGTAGQEKARKPKTLPWLAVAMMPEAFRAEPSAWMEAGDLERCVAWTVLEALAAKVVQ